MSIIMRRTQLLAFRVPIRLRANEGNIEQNKNQFPLRSIKLDTRWYETPPYKYT